MPGSQEQSNKVRQNNRPSRHRVAGAVMATPAVPPRGLGGVTGLVGFANDACQIAGIGIDQRYTSRDQEYPFQVAHLFADSGVAKT